MKSNGALYWYGGGGEVLTRTDLAGGSPSEYVFFGGRRIALRGSSGAVYYYLSDHLGSSRILADASGVTYYDADFCPYGGAGWRRHRLVMSANTEWPKLRPHP